MLTVNKLFGAVEGSATRTIGVDTIHAGNAKYLPSPDPPPEIKLVKVVEFEEFVGDGSFKGPSGEVNVIRVEVIDAILYYIYVVRV